MADVVGAGRPESGLFDSIRENLNPVTWMKKLNITGSKLLEMGIYLCAGFLVGYLIKKYGKFLIVLILGCLGLLLLQQLGIISLQFHADKFQELFGIQSVVPTSDGGLVLMYWEWVKANVVLVLSFSVGFLIGLRVG